MPKAQSRPGSPAARLAAAVVAELTDSGWNQLFRWFRAWKLEAIETSEIKEIQLEGLPSIERGRMQCNWSTSANSDVQQEPARGLIQLPPVSRLCVARRPTPCFQPGKIQTIAPEEERVMPSRPKNPFGGRCITRLSGVFMLLASAGDNPMITL
jgi:hypothetical protein